MKIAAICFLVLLFIGCNGSDPNPTDPGRQDTVYVNGDFKKTVLTGDDVISVELQMIEINSRKNVVVSEEGKKYLGLYKNHGIEFDSIIGPYFKLVEDSNPFTVFKEWTNKHIECNDSRVTDKVINPILYEYDLMLDSNVVEGHMICGIAYTESITTGYMSQVNPFYFKGKGIALNYDISLLGSIGNIIIYSN